MAETLLFLTIWIVLSIVCFFIGMLLGKKQKPETPKLTQEEKRKQEKETRELLNFYAYNGDKQAE